MVLTWNGCLSILLPLTDVPRDGYHRFALSYEPEPPRA